MAPRADHPDCVFCAVDPERLVAANELAFALRDTAPVVPLHTLVLPRRHGGDRGTFRSGAGHLRRPQRHRGS